jgi:hypothetical protein
MIPTITDQRSMRANLISNSQHVEKVIEQPVDIGGRGRLFGIMARPVGPVQSTGFVFLNSGLLHRVGPFRLYVDLARRIADSGFPSIRLDQSGKGDSAAAQGIPLREATVKDVTAAADHLKRETGVTSLVVGGLCSGADDALQVAAQISGLSGVFLFDGYAPRTARYFVQHFVPRLLPHRVLRKGLRTLRNRLRASSGDAVAANDAVSLRNWSTRRDMIEIYRGLVDQRIKILAMFTSQAYRQYNYVSQLTEALGRKQAHSLVTERYYPSATHLFPVTQHRRSAVTDFAEWVERSFDSREES